MKLKILFWPLMLSIMVSKPLWGAFSNNHCYAQSGQSAENAQIKCYLDPQNPDCGAGCGHYHTLGYLDCLNGGTPPKDIGWPTVNCFGCCYNNMAEACPLGITPLPSSASVSDQQKCYNKCDETFCDTVFSGTEQGYCWQKECKGTGH